VYPAGKAVTKVIVLFGTRPEVIKLAPVVRELAARRDLLVVGVASGQHTELLYPFAQLLGLPIDHDLRAMAPAQAPGELCARVLAGFDAILARERPELLLVQGDTTTALAGALAAFQRRVPVAHVEAGLRSGDAASPFPEEMNRRLIARLASWHFAATPRNREALLAEGVPAPSVFVTGNTVVDALQSILASAQPGAELRALVEETRRFKRLVLTTHRRESLGEPLAANLRALRAFVERHPDVALLFPVHPNPAVQREARALLSGHERIRLLGPLAYPDFIHLLSAAWLIVSDSGGVQEEAPSLGRPLLILRANTERPESVEAGIARLVGGGAEALAVLLEQAIAPGSWAERVGVVQNPFGRGDAARRIAEILAEGPLRPACERVAQGARA
jgi:UDP-N-acetylglucosamine 2-epimerase (non-hydrolysing)